ncbi:MAG: hypothetical protein BHW64_04745 [Candidatus Melainabacteria bacterium LEY3_CP_29_8]|nr:MAG: hypothetical protein BHW64_04745 [Candidatus Melainabacteria bacterium LEY3_CP_29_8]
MQNIGQTYKDYKKELPNYKAWKKQRDIRNAKKEYLFKTKPPSEEELKRAKAKADILFNAIDVMDDYSQEKAEDTETAIALAQYASQKAPSSLGLVVGGFLGLTKLPKNFWIKQFSRNKELKKEIDKTVTLPINIPFMKSNSFKLGTAISVFMTGSICASIFGLINNIFFSKLSVKCEIAASKAARFEAMQKELDDYNQFAILNDEQKNEVNKIAKNVKLSKKEKKRELTKYKTTFSMFDYLGPFKTAKELLKNAVEDNKMRENYVAYIEKEIQKNYNKDLTQEEILEAKKDKELLTSMIENIDIKSQDYAENTELITQTAGLIMSIVSALVITPLVAKVVSKTKNFLLQAVVSPLSSILLIVLPCYILPIFKNYPQKLPAIK